MSLIFFLSALLLLVAAGASENDDRIENETPRDDAVAYESFGSPVYGPRAAAVANFGGLPPPGKSSYSVPAPPAIPASYAGYLNGLGYANPYSFNRFGVMPYAAPYGYGSPYGYGGYGTLPYGPVGYGGAFAGGLGYPGGLPYSPFMGRWNLGYPGNAGLGYRYGGVPAAGFRGLPAPAPLTPPAPVAAPVAPVPPPPAPVVRAPLATTVGKDGSLRYAYAPLQGQKIPGY